MPIRDVAESPASLNQRRLVSTGSIGVISNPPILELTTYTTGTFSVQGREECDFYEGFGYTKPFTYSLDRLPKKPLCVYNLHMRDNYLDAPVIGMMLIRKFDQEISPLKMLIEGASVQGTGSLQVMSGGDKEITLYPNGSSGTAYISGCGLNISYGFTEVLTFNLKSLYPVDRDCVVDILVNNSDYPKEGASVLVGVYRKGSFLDAPTSRLSFLKRKRCFAFQDKYVGLTIINGVSFKGSSGCVSKADSYVVQGVTSVGRIFYGKYVHPKWEWVK